MRIKLATMVAAAFLLLAAHSQAQAQFSTMHTPTWYEYGVMRQQTVNVWSARNKLREYQRKRNASAARRSAASSRTGGQGVPSGGVGAGVSATPKTAQTFFRPVSSSIMPQEFARLIARTPDERPKLESWFNELLSRYRMLLQRNGSPENDVARAASYLVSQSYYVYRGGQPLTKSQFEALRRQMQEVLQEDAAFLNRSDEEKQRMYESYAITGAFLGIGFDAMRQQGNTKTAGELREMASQQLQELLGAPADRVRFTDAGIQY